MTKYAFAICLASVVVYGFVPAEQTPCGSALSEEQMTRRREQVTVARQINTAEAQAFSAGRKYLALPLLNGVVVPDGFDVQVSTDGESYTFSVKDTNDQCRAAVFSDQKGLIYTALPLQ